MEGVGRRLDAAVESLEALEKSLEPAAPRDFGAADVELVGVYYHHLWQVVLGMLGVGAISAAERTVFRNIFGEDIDLEQLRRLRHTVEYTDAVESFADFIEWIIVFESTLVAFDSRASRMQEMSLELVAVFESLVNELFIVPRDDISWRNYRYSRALEALRAVLGERWDRSQIYRQ